MLRPLVLATCVLAAATPPAFAACTRDLAPARSDEEIARAAASAVARLDGAALETLLAPNATVYAASDGSLGEIPEVTARLAEMRAELPPALPPHRVTGVLVSQDTVAVRIARRWSDGSEVESLMAFHIQSGCITSAAIMD